MGMKKNVKDISGHVFGKLTAIEYAYTKNENAYWKCMCACGNEHIACGSSLRRRRNPTKSCGCSLKNRVCKPKKEKTQEMIDEQYLKAMRHHINSRIKASNKEVTLTDEDLLSITKADCYYCGSKPSNIIRLKRKWGNIDIIYQGIDRIDSSKGYIPDNVRPCCKHCNFAKSTLTETQFFEHIERIYKHMKGDTNE